MKLMEEMKRVGLKPIEINSFQFLGLALWATVLGLFVNRYYDIEETSDANQMIRNVNIIIISFHVAVLALTFMETNYMGQWIWLSWIIIGLALSATFLNAIVVARVLDDSNPPYQGRHGDDSTEAQAIASIVLQCMANALMTAYIFKIIRSKKRLTF